MKPLVSICIPNYNTADFVTDTIKCALAQTYKRKEVIVIDDLSTDGSVAAVKRFGKKVRLFQNRKNLGYPGNMNRCVDLARGKYIVFLNSDDLLDRDAVKRQVELMESNPSVGIVHGTSRVIAEAGKVTGEIRTFREDRVLNGMKRLQTLLEGNSIVCSSVMARKECFSVVGGFDKGIYYCSDWDMWMRICTKYDIAYISDAIASYRVRAGNMSDVYGSKKLGGVDKLKALRKIETLLRKDRNLAGSVYAQNILRNMGHYYSVLAVEGLVRGLQLSMTGYPAAARKHISFAASVRKKIIPLAAALYVLSFFGARPSGFALSLGRRAISNERLYSVKKSG